MEGVGWAILPVPALEQTWRKPLGCSSIRRSGAVRINIHEVPPGCLPLGMHPAEFIGEREATLHRISTDVLDHSVEMFFVTNNSIVGFLLPEGARSLCALVDLPCRDPFDLLEDVFQFESSLGAYDDMTVVRHDDAAAEEVFLAMPKLETLPDNRRFEGVLQLAPPVTFIERTLESASDITLIPFAKIHATGMIPKSGEFSSNASQLQQNRLRQCIRQPEGHEVSRSRLTPMRQVAFIVAELPMRIELSKAGRCGMVEHPGGLPFEWVTCRS